MTRNSLILICCLALAVPGARAQGEGVSSAAVAATAAGARAQVEGVSSAAVGSSAASAAPVDVRQDAAGAVDAAGSVQPGWQDGKRPVYCNVMGYNFWGVGKVKVKLDMGDGRFSSLYDADGRNVYSRWAARQMARTLYGNDLSEVSIVCVPASTHTANVRRWKLFSHLLCKQTGASDAFSHITVSGSRKRAHVTGEYELATNIKHFVDFDADYFRGRKVIVIDDIYTTGRSSQAFIGALEACGAHVVMALFLAKTRRLCG